MRRTCLSAACVIVSSVFLSLHLVTSPLLAVTPVEVDDFEDGTTEGWQIGQPGPGAPTNEPDGGPLGVGDAYLGFLSDGGASAGKLVVFNTAQWTGDYLAARIEAIAVDLRNFGATDLTLRLRIEGAGGTWVSKDGLVLPAGSGWMSLTFPIGPDAIVGGLDLENTLGGVSKLRIFHNPAATAQGPNIVAQVGADNIRAIASVSEGGSQRPGDANQDRSLDISDAVFLLGYLFLGSTDALPCGDGDPTHPANVALLDANGDGGIDLSDAVATLSFLFGGGPPPPLGTECTPIVGCPDACSG